MHAPDGLTNSSFLKKRMNEWVLTVRVKDRQTTDKERWREEGQSEMHHSGTHAKRQNNSSGERRSRWRSGEVCALTNNTTAYEKKQQQKKKIIVLFGGSAAATGVGVNSIRSNPIRSGSGRRSVQIKGGGKNTYYYEIRYFRYCRIGR